jgi:hypothetical protein
MPLAGVAGLEDLGFELPHALIHVRIVVSHQQLLREHVHLLVLLFEPRIQCGNLRRRR